MSRAPRRVRPEPVLRVTEPSGPASAIAMVLHGGQSIGTDPVPPWSGAVLRMIPFTRALTRAGAADGLVVARLRYRRSGWNGNAQSPVQDARWALSHLTDRFPGLPIGLIGHSMGGRTAIHVAGDPAVRSVVGLAPWIEPGDPIDTLRGRRVLIVHGDADETTDPNRSAALVDRVRNVAQSAGYVGVRGGKHSMLGRAHVWHELAAGFTVGVLFGKTYNGTDNPAIANVITKALDGQPVSTL